MLDFRWVLTRLLPLIFTLKIFIYLQRPVDAPKGEEEPGVENRLVLCSSKDVFVLQQDVCVMCGAFGNDLEGRLISCAQCGQCYHPYCVNVKVCKSVLIVNLGTLMMYYIDLGEQSPSAKGMAVSGLHCV